MSGVKVLALLLFLLAVPAPGQDVAKPPRALHLLGEFDVGQGGEVASLAFSADGSLLAAGSQVGEVVVSRVDTGELVVRLLAARETPTLTFSPDGRRLAAVGARDLRVFAIPGGEMVAAREVFERSPVAWSPDGKVVLAQTTPDSISMLASEDLAEQQRLAWDQGRPLDTMTWGREGYRVAFTQFRRGTPTPVRRPTGDLAAVARRGTVQLVAADGSVVLESRLHRAPPDEVVVVGGDPRGGRFVVARTSLHVGRPTEPSLVVYDAATGERHAVTMTPFPRAIRASPASPDVLLTGTQTFLWSPRDRAPTLTIGARRMSTPPVWSPDARWIWLGRPLLGASQIGVATVFDVSGRAERDLAMPQRSLPLA